MSLQKIHAMLLLATAVSCQPPLPGNVTDQGIYFNLRDYYYPAYKLMEPTVYCYADSTGEIKMYMQHQISVSGTDSMLITLSYDSAFTLKSKSTETYEDRGLYPGTMEVMKSGKLVANGRFDTGFTAWRQPLQSDSISFFYHCILTNGTVTVKSDISGYFSEVRDSIQVKPYKPEDCVQMYEFYNAEAGDPFQETRTVAFNTKMVYARGVGMIYSQEPTGGTTTKYYLRKIVPASAFSGLKPK